MMAEMEEISKPKLSGMSKALLEGTRMTNSQHATYRGDDGQEVDIVDLWHMHVGQDREVVKELDRMSQPLR